MSQSDNGNSAITMRDVARVAGVSRMTVSRALKKDSPVSKATRERILQVVRDMNYVPDQMAGSLTTKRSGFVAVLVPSLNNLHFAETVQALTRALEQIGQQILLGYTDYSAEREEQLVEAMLRRRPEAIVLSYDGHTDRTVQLLAEAHVPVIELWERPEDPIAHTVGFSNLAAAAEMTRALIARGYRNIGFLGEAEDDWTRGAARRKGFIQAMEAAGLSAHRLLRIGKPPLSIEDGSAAVPKMLVQYPDVDCIFCVSDVAAFGVLSALKEAGRSVPNDIGVVGFGNFEVSRFATPTITTVTVDPTAIGTETGRMIAQLLAQMDSPPQAHSQINIEVQLTFRGSTKPL
ncbi:MAG: LacI family DNA-binding transcriptional regulator [Roseobacter sp.]